MKHWLFTIKHPSLTTSSYHRKTRRKRLELIIHWEFQASRFCKSNRSSEAFKTSPSFFVRTLEKQSVKTDFAAKNSSPTSTRMLRSRSMKKDDGRNHCNPFHLPGSVIRKGRMNDEVSWYFQEDYVRFIARDPVWLWLCLDYRVSDHWTQWRDAINAKEIVSTLGKTMVA